MGHDGEPPGGTLLRDHRRGTARIGLREGRLGAHGVHHALAPERVAMTPREWVNRLWGSLRRARTDRDLEEELRIHLELAADEERRRGAPEGNAVRTARLRVGAVAQAMEAQRDQRGLVWLDGLARDVRVS